MGCVSYSVRYFPDGKINKSNLKQAELAARSEVADHRFRVFYACHWNVAFGSSGSARVMCDILEQNGYSDGGITREGLEQLRAQLLKAGDVNETRICLDLKPDRIPVLPGGFAIMYAAFCELGIDTYATRARCIARRVAVRPAWTLSLQRYARSHHATVHAPLSCGCSPGDARRALLQIFWRNNFWKAS